MAITTRTATTNSSSTAVTSMPLTKPSGATVDDVLVATITTNGSTTVSAAPSGWTLAGSMTALSNPKIYAYYRRLTSADASVTSYTWTASASDTWGGNMQAFVGVDTSTALDAAVVTTNNSASTTTSFPFTATTVTDGAVLVSTLGANTGSTVNATEPSGWTRDGAASGGAFTNGKANALAHFTLPTAGTGTSTWTISSGRAGGTITLALRPAAGGGTPPPDPPPSTPGTVDYVSGNMGMFQTATTSTSHTVSVTAPASITAGNLLVAATYSSAGPGNLTGVTPSGWTQALAFNDVDQVGYVYYKIASASEPTTYSFAWTGGSTARNAYLTAAVAQYSGAVTSSPVVVTGGSSITSTTTMTAPTVTPSAAAGRLACFFFTYLGSPVTVGSPLTARVAVNNTTTETGGAFGDQAFTSAAATGTRTATQSPAAEWVAFSVAIAAAPVSATQVQLGGTVTMQQTQTRAFTKTVTASSAPAGTIRRAGLAKTFTGSVTAAGTKIGRVTRNTLFGAVFPEGYTQRGYPRTVSGVLTAAGTVAKRSAGRFFFGTITGAGTAVRATTKRFTATSTPAGTTGKQSRLVKLGTIIGFGAPNQLGVRVRTVVGSLTPAAVIRKVAANRPAGSATPAGVFRSRAFTKRPKGSLTPASTLLAELFRRVFGRAGTAAVLVGAAAEIDIVFYERHRVQVTVELETAGGKPLLRPMDAFISSGSRFLGTAGDTPVRSTMTSGSSFTGELSSSSGFGSGFTTGFVPLNTSATAAILFSTSALSAAANAPVGTAGAALVSASTFSGTTNFNIYGRGYTGGY